MHKRHVLPKEEDRRRAHQRDIMQPSYYPPRPIMAIPSYHSNHTLSPAPMYPMWPQPGNQPAGVQMWGTPDYRLWQPAESWHAWNPLPGVKILVLRNEAGYEFSSVLATFLGALVMLD